MALKRFILRACSVSTLVTLRQPVKNLSESDLVYSRDVRNRATLTLSVSRAKTPITATLGQSTSRPTPLRYRLRRMKTTCRSEIAQTLKKKGMLLIGVPNPESVVMG